MGDEAVSIFRAANGYMVKFSDPDIVESNKKGDKFESPVIKMVFTDVAAVLKFLSKNLAKLAPEDEFDSAFAKALEE